MRKVALLFGWALLCLACSPIDLNPHKGAEKVELCFTAYFENAATKTERQKDDGTGNYPVFWCPGDAVSLFFNEGDQGGSRFVAQNTTKVEKATFKGTITGFAGGGELTGGEFWFWGVYPYSEENSCDGSSVTISLPAKQNAKEGSFDDGLWPTMAKSKGLELAFFNICGGIMFSVSRNDIVAVKFRGNNNESLAGKARIAWDKNGHPVVTEHLNGIQEVTVSLPGGGPFVPGENYYIIFYPELLSGGFTLTYITSDAKQGVLSSTSSRQFKRGIFVPAVELDSRVSSWTDVEDPSGQGTNGTEGGTESGLYLGMSTFERNVYYYPVHLISELSIGNYNTIIDNFELATQIGTKLYYSIDEDITALQRINLPSDLYNVSIVTFTDGVDLGSLAKRLDLDDDEEYLQLISNRLRQEKVSGLPMQSYAIGLNNATDVEESDLELFNKNLADIASEPQNPSEKYSYYATNMPEVNSAFENIASQIVQNFKVQTLEIRIPLPGNGVKERFTLDNKSADASDVYIQGVFEKSTFTLKDVDYQGLSSSSGNVVVGSFDGDDVTFRFEGIPVAENGEIEKSNIQHYFMRSSSSSWQKNTNEFDPEENTKTYTRNQSALVMINLDLSKSLTGQLNNLKQIVKSFIAKLYENSVDPDVVKKVSLNKTELDLVVGQSETLIASVSPSTASTSGLRWSSAIPSVATVDQNGQVTALSEGTTIISVSSEDGKELATCTVHVSFLHLESISLNYTEQTLYVGKRVTLVATASPSNASDKTVTWTSSSPSVATVSNSGEVTGVANGTATITATTTDGGKTATCSVTVADYAPSTTPIDLSLAVTIKETGTRGYIAQSELQFADMSKYEPSGLTVLSGTGDFIIALEDASSTRMVHSAAAKFYYLPTYDQGITISARFTDINSALVFLGGDQLNSSSFYWTSKQGNSGYYYTIKGSGGILSSRGEDDSWCVREVIAIDNTELTTFVTKSVGVNYTYKNGEDRFFVSKIEDIPDGCTPEGLAIKSSTGCGNVILAFENASSDAMTWTSAAAVYGSSNFPSKEQGELISARFYEVNAALQHYGNSLNASSYYWTSLQFEPSSEGRHYTILGSGGKLYVRYDDNNHYVRLVLGTF